MMFKKKEEQGGSSAVAYTEKPAKVPVKHPPPRIFDVPQGAYPSGPQPPDGGASPTRFLEKEEPEATLGAGVVVQGKLSFSRYLRIDGTFEGELSSGKKVFVGPTGCVKADIRVDEAIIEGKVVGSLTVTQRLELRNQATVHGDIETELLSIDEGARIVGGVKVNPPQT